VNEKPQVDKFRHLARELETDDDEARFDERLKKLAAAKPKNLKGYWQVAQVDGGHQAVFISDELPNRWRPSPVFPTPQGVYGWLEGHGCKQRADDSDKWDD